MKKADNLQSKQRNEIGYGRGEYTVPIEDIDKFFEPKSKKPKKVDIAQQLQALNKEENVLKEEFKELRKLYDAYKDKPKSLVKIRNRMIEIKNKVDLIRIEKMKYRKKAPIEARLRKIIGILNKKADGEDLINLQKKYERESSQLKKLENNADALLSKAIDLRIKVRSKQFILQNKGNPDAITSLRDKANKAFNLWEQTQQQVDLQHKRVEGIKEELDKLLSEDK